MIHLIIWESKNVEAVNLIELLVKWRIIDEKDYQGQSSKFKFLGNSISLIRFKMLEGKWEILMLKDSKIKKGLLQQLHASYQLLKRVLKYRG